MSSWLKAGKYIVRWKPSSTSEDMWFWVFQGIIISYEVVYLNPRILLVSICRKSGKWFMGRVHVLCVSMLVLGRKVFLPITINEDCWLLDNCTLLDNWNQLLAHVIVILVFWSSFFFVHCVIYWWSLCVLLVLFVTFAAEVYSGNSCLHCSWGFTQARIWWQGTRKFLVEFLLMLSSLIGFAFMYHYLNWRIIMTFFCFLWLDTSQWVLVAARSI